MKGFCLNHPENGNGINPYSHCHGSLALMDQSYENLADLDEEVLESYVGGTLSSFAGMDKKVQEKILSKDLVPFHFGIAKLGIGIPELADSLCKIASKNSVNSKGVNARIFKIEHHAKTLLGRHDL
jgi:hypothetical protein